MRRAIFFLTALIFSLAFSLPTNQSVYAIEQQFLEKPTVVYGANLSDSQKEEVRRHLSVMNPDEVIELVVSGEDIYHYLGHDRNSRMFSSVKITHEEEGHGIIVHIVTPDYITEVTSEMYRNALLTAGIEDATIEVAAPKAVTGHSALTGIYKAYDEAGVELDKDRLEVADEELSLTTKLTEKHGLSDEKVTELMTEIKKAIADQNPATKEDVERIIQEQLDKLEINLSEEDRQLLLDLFDKMRQLDIDFGQVRDQLEDLTKTIKERLDEMNIEIDESFWEKVKQFFIDLIDSIAALFSNKNNE